jgi:hypothetical protein
MALQRQFLKTILPPFYPISLGWWGLFFMQKNIYKTLAVR